MGFALFFERGFPMELITSKNNPAVMAAAKLADKKYRERTGTFAFEGIKLFSEAISSQVCLVRVFATESAYEKYGDLLLRAGEDKLTLVSTSVYEKLSFERAPQGVFCVAEYFSPAQKEDPSFAIVLDGVADPGNFGAVLRSADAFGVDAVYVGSDSADLYNPKTVRACMGSLFRVNVRRVDSVESQVRDLISDGFRVYATTLDARSEDIRKVSLSGKIAFVIGNEGHGVSRSVADACTGSVIIPMREGPQSLNAAVASGIVMWEAARGRMMM